jgi:hypothetical protein
MERKRRLLNVMAFFTYSLLLIGWPVVSNALVISGNNMLYTKTLVVGPAGSPAQNGAALLNALAGIVGASSTNPYLLKIEPGIYDIDDASLQMQPYVDIEGSGENTTIITGNVDGPNSGTINGASNAELRFLTAQNTGGKTFAIAIDNINSNASPKITNVTAIASGTPNNIGINIYSASPILTNVTAKAEAPGGTYNHGVVNNTVNSIDSSTVLKNVTATASGGTYNNGVYNTNSSSVVMRNVTATASGGTISNGVFNDHSSFEMEYVNASASDGVTNNGVMNLVSAPLMSHVRATASGGTNSNGVFNQDSANPNPFLYYVQASAHDATGFSTGIRNVNSNPAIRFCSAAAKDSVTTSVRNGMFNDGSSPYVYSTLILAQAVPAAACIPNGCFGVYNTTSGTVRIDLSVVYAYTNTIYNNNVFTYIGNTQLNGSPVFNGGTGTLKCIGTYNNTYDPITCP